MKRKVTHPLSRHCQPELVDRAISRPSHSRDSFVTTLTQTTSYGVPAWTQADLERLLIADETYQLNLLNCETFALSQSIEPLQPVLLVAGVGGCNKILNAQPQFDGMQFMEVRVQIDNVPACIECTINRNDRSVPVSLKK